MFLKLLGDFLSLFLTSCSMHVIENLKPVEKSKNHFSVIWKSSKVVLIFKIKRFHEFTISWFFQGTSEKTRKEKLLLMSWCPDTARIKKKMLYSSSFDALKKCLVGVQKYIQVCKLFSQWGQNHYEVVLNINNVLTQNTAD